LHNDALGGTELGREEKVFGGIGAEAGDALPALEISAQRTEEDHVLSDGTCVHHGGIVAQQQI